MLTPEYSQYGAFVGYKLKVYPKTFYNPIVIDAKTIDDAVRIAGEKLGQQPKMKRKRIR